MMSKFIINFWTYLIILFHFKINFLNTILLIIILIDMKFFKQIKQLSMNK